MKYETLTDYAYSTIHILLRKTALNINIPCMVSCMPGNCSCVICEISSNAVPLQVTPWLHGSIVNDAIARSALSSFDYRVVLIFLVISGTVG